MSELLKYINGILDEAIESENNLMNIYVRLIRSYEGLEKEKFEDVAGLKKPNFFAFMHDGRSNKEELEVIKFAIEAKIKNNEERRKKDEMGRKLGG